MPTTALPPPTTPTTDPGSFTDPNAGGATGNLSTSLAGAFGIPTADLSIVVPGFNGRTLQQMIQDFQTAPAAARAPVIEQLQAAGYFSGLTSGSELDRETTAYARLLRDSIWSGRDPNATLQDASQAQALGAGQAVQPRYIGLGKYPVKLTAPEDVKMTADSIFQTLLGRRATQSEVDAVTGALHNLEKTAGATEFQQYTSQQEAYFESQHYGTATPGGAPAGTGVAAPPTTATPAQLSPARIQMSQATGSPAGASTLPADTPPSQIPANAIKLTDGTYIIPPTQTIYPGAPSAAGAAYDYAQQNYQPEIRGRTAAAALQAMSAALGKGV